MKSEQIQDIFPKCRHPADWVRPLNDAMDKYDISDDLRRIAAFLGQIGVESGQLNSLEENLSYSPQRLTEVWPDKFPTMQDAMPYARNPERLANLVYADRLGNGPAASGDGYRYRGRGLIQLTGRANYVRMQAVIPGLVEMPDYLVQPRYAAVSAAAFWAQRGLNEIADTIGKKKVATVVTTITKLVNGGNALLDERIAFTQKAVEVLDTEFAV